MELIIVSIGNILCFIIGAIIGQKTSRNESININPIKAIDTAITEHREVKEKQEEDEYNKTIMYNIDNYDGTGLGQKNLPTKR